MNYVMQTYARLPLALAKGEGCWVWDTDGNKYLDLVAGIAVCNLGHCHPDVVAAVQKQAGQLFHCSNLYRIPQQEALAAMLVENSFEGQVFFCNSGAEANEGAIKLIRRHGNKKHKLCNRIITCTGSFHGRTLATVAATGQERFRQGFDPVPEGFLHVPYGDFSALENSIDDTIAGILLEPIQGESGVQLPPPGYLKKVRDLCDARGIVMALDEVQTGYGRTGALFAHQHENIQPDLMTMAKAMGNGFPMGGFIAKPWLAQAFEPGSHASTFGGNPLAMAAGLATLEVMQKEHIVQKSLTQGVYFRKRMTELKEQHPAIKEVRGKGLMTGVEFSQPVGFLTTAGLSKGLLCNVVKDQILRLVPPLTITVREIDTATNILDEILKEHNL